MASWVQAIGSIGAIVGAFFVVSYQGREQTRLRQREALQESIDTGDVVVAICIDAVRAIRDSAESFRRHTPGDSFVSETDRLDEAQQSLRILLSRRVPPEMMHSLLRIQRTVTYAHRALRQRSGTTKAISQRTIDSADGRHRIAAKELNQLARMRNALKARI
ncbi:hypothetical protein [Cupriavidus necator]|uniref:hypothetical protein n=1 Tax=Cupriavidus necator TaxID=106590 RepID=UPI00115F8440|nr:hypothetical protein [Cupriavidus necator]